MFGENVNCIIRKTDYYFCPVMKYCATALTAQLIRTGILRKLKVNMWI